MRFEEDHSFRAELLDNGFHIDAAAVSERVVSPAPLEPGDSVARDRLTGRPSRSFGQLGRQPPVSGIGPNFSRHVQQLVRRLRLVAGRLAFEERINWPVIGSDSAIHGSRGGAGSATWFDPVLPAAMLFAEFQNHVPGGAGARAGGPVVQARSTPVSKRVIHVVTHSREIPIAAPIWPVSTSPDGRHGWTRGSGEGDRE